MTFTDTTDGRVTAHLTQSFDVMCEQQEETYPEFRKKVRAVQGLHGALRINQEDVTPDRAAVRSDGGAEIRAGDGSLRHLWWPVQGRV